METFISREGKTEKPVALKLTFTNVSEKAIKFNAHDFIWSLIKGDVKALTADSVTVQRIAFDRIPLAPKAEDFPEIKPGENWTFEKNLAFPGAIPEGGSTFAQYSVVKPGEFRIKFTYISAKGNDTPLFKNSWSGELVSNELVIAVKAEQPKKEAAGPVVNGLQLSLTADKIETFISRDGKTETPITFKLTFANVGDKAIKFNAFDYTFSRIKGEVKAMPADSLKFSLYGPGRKKIIPLAGDFLEIKSGQSWSHAKRYEFPGTIIAGSSMFARYTVLKPGEFRVKFSYNSPRDDSPFAKDMWIGELVSNEVVIAVKAEAPPKE